MFAAVAAGIAHAAPLRAAVETVFANDETLRAVWQAGDARCERIVQEIGALLAHAERYRCSECGFVGAQLLLALSCVSVLADLRDLTLVKLR